MIIHRIQPTPKSCGQTVLAMLLGVPVRDVFVLLPGPRETPYRGDPLPARAIIRIAWDGPPKQGHWVLWSDGRFYDPGMRDATFCIRAGRIVGVIAVPTPLPSAHAQE